MFLIAPPPATQEVRIELVEGRRDHVEILDRRAFVGCAPQHRDLLLGRGVDLDHVAVDPAPARRRGRASSGRGQPRIRDLQADAGRQPGDAAQLVERAVGDLDPRFMMTTRPARSSNSVSTCEDSRTVAPRARSSSTIS